jgi:ABC-2 type transport system permease protein
MRHPGWLAFISRDWRIARSYRFPFVAGVLSGVISLSLYFFLSGIVSQDRLPAGAGREQGYFAFALVGIVVFDVLVVGLYAVARRIREEQTQGTLEVVVATPAPGWLIAVGSASYEVLYGLASGAFSAAVGIAIFGVKLSLEPGAIPLLVVVSIATLVFVGALGIALAALTIVIKQTSTVAGLLATAVALLSGAYFPVTTLPEPLRSLSWVSPFRWSMDVARSALFGGTVPVGELVALLTVSAFGLPLSFALFRRSVARAKRTGSLAQY